MVILQAKGKHTCGESSIPFKDESCSVSGEQTPVVSGYRSQNPGTQTVPERYPKGHSWLMDVCSKYMW